MSDQVLASLCLLAHTVALAAVVRPAVGILYNTVTLLHSLAVSILTV